MRDIAVWNHKPMVMLTSCCSSSYSRTLQRWWRDVRSSGSDGHVVPGAGWPLGDAVAAQVLVDVCQLLSGGAVRHVQARVVAVGLRAPRVHRLQQVLAVQHADLWWGAGRVFERFIGNAEDLRCDWRVSPAQWLVCSWRCWDLGAPLQNTTSLRDLEQEADPPGTAAELEDAKENKCFKALSTKTLLTWGVRTSD